VVLEQEENWKFRLTNYKDRLRDWLSKSECEFMYEDLLGTEAEQKPYGRMRIVKPSFGSLIR
jgi:hypothetical protein